MKIGVFCALFNGKPLDEALSLIASKGVHMVEIGCGGFPGNNHANPEVLLNDEKAFAEFKATFEKYDMQISAFSCHSNPISPDKAEREEAQKTIKNAILLAEKMGIHQINTFSGCAGDCPESKRPNWVTCAWPPAYQEILDYQWNECLIPYWKETAAFALAHGVDKIALELHPGFMVYNTASMLKLREAVGPVMGANLDPSHLIWQGMDPVLVIRTLKDAIFHFHAKDTKVDTYNCALNGVLDTTSLADVSKRSWAFRTVGYGNDMSYWKGIISELRNIGYDHAISIEHEDALMSDVEGLTKAIEFLKDVVIETQPTDAFWA